MNWLLNGIIGVLAVVDDVLDIGRDNLAEAGHKILLEGDNRLPILERLLLARRWSYSLSSSWKVNCPACSVPPMSWDSAGMVSSAGLR